MTALLYPGSPTQAKPKAACGVFPGGPDTNQRSVCGGEKPRPRCAFMTQSGICSAECRRRKRVQRYCKFLTFATFWAEKCVAKCRLFVPPDSHAITRSRRAKFGLLKKFFIFLPKNLHICNLVSIKQLRGTFDAPFCPCRAPSPYLSGIGAFE